MASPTPRVLVIDDSEDMRSFFEDVLTLDGSCEVLGAADGLEGLAMVERERPDLVVLDVSLPVLSGIEVLQALRADPNHATRPVVIISGRSDAQVVGRLIALGITDYLVKPFALETVQQRLGGALQKAGLGRPRPRPDVAPAGLTPGERRILLVADRDPNFRTFAAEVLGTKFDVVEAASGVEALRALMERRPPIALLGEGLPLLNERLLVRKARDLGLAGLRVFLCAEQDRLDGDDERLFDGLVRKSFVPRKFRAEFTRAALGGESGGDALGSMLQSELALELQTAVQQTVGVLTGEDARPLRPDELERVGVEIGASVTLRTADGGGVVRAAIGTRERDARAVCQRMLGIGGGEAWDLGDALGEMANIVAGRLAASLEQRGLHLTMARPSIFRGPADPGPAGWVLAFGVVTDSGARYWTGVALDIDYDELTRAVFWERRALVSGQRRQPAPGPAAR